MASVRLHGANDSMMVFWRSSPISSASGESRNSREARVDGVRMESAISNHNVRTARSPILRRLSSMMRARSISYSFCGRAIACS